MKCIVLHCTLYCIWIHRTRAQESFVERQGRAITKAQAAEKKRKEKETRGTDTSIGRNI